MKKCSYEDSLLLYMDSLLSDSEKEDFLHHLDNCQICKNQMDFFRKMEEDFNIPVPEDFTFKIMEEIKKPSVFFQIFPLIIVIGISLILFFSFDTNSLLPIAGNLMVKLFLALKHIPVHDFLRDLIKQNSTFLLSYTCLLFIMTVFSILWKKKNQFVIKNYII
jgi:hypothetical protein